MNLEFNRFMVFFLTKAHQLGCIVAPTLFLITVKIQWDLCPLIPDVFSLFWLSAGCLDQVGGLAQDLQHPSVVLPLLTSIQLLPP